MKKYFREHSAYDLERHRNALDLGLIYIENDLYELPEKWDGKGIRVDLSASGNEQFQILKSIVIQLAGTLNSISFAM